jgi:Protein of unknown function (DUF4245)
MLGSAKSMVLSMVAVLVGCAIWIWAVPQSTNPPKPVKNVASIAREVGIEQKWDVALPQGLPKQWVPINIRLIRVDSQPPTWHAGYQAPDEEFVSAEQTDKGDDAWIRRQTQDGDVSGSMTIKGVRWTRYVSGDVNSLVRTAPLGGLRTVVSGKTDWATLQTFAAALQPQPATTS